jgi:hydrogenase maturation protease
VSSEKSVLILGVGNLLWADEGFGVRALETMQQWYGFPENVRLLDGGTQGVYLVQDIREADVLIVFDAVDYGLPPATIKVVEGDDVPRFLGVKKVSLHQTGFQEVLALAEMMGDYPEKLLLVGVQPEEIEDYGGSLRPAVKAQIQPCIDIALDYLSGFGISASRYAEAHIVDVTAAGTIADMETYETQRPSTDQACRTGDDRVLKSDRYEVTPRHVALKGDALSVNVDEHLDQYR